MRREEEKRVVEFVRARPRTIQEVAHLLRKNWRTADRHVERIATETGAIAVWTFRGGTRGALKIVYATPPEHVAATALQERLTQHILAGRKKEDFSPLDIFAHVAEERREAFLETQKGEKVRLAQDVTTLFRSARESVLIYSGNLSWSNVRQGEEPVMEVLAEVAQSVPVKVLCRVDIASLRNLEKVRVLNERLGREAIEVRHAEHPLRGFVVDGREARFKETKSPSEYKRGELDAETFIFYNIRDEEWVEWLRKLFFAMFRTALPMEHRLTAIESIRQSRLL